MEFQPFKTTTGKRTPNFENLYKAMMTPSYFDIKRTCFPEVETPRQREEIFRCHNKWSHVSKSLNILLNKTSTIKDLKK